MDGITSRDVSYASALPARRPGASKSRESTAMHTGFTFQPNRKGWGAGASPQLSTKAFGSLSQTQVRA
jgi:hypothetical protein